MFHKGWMSSSFTFTSPCTLAIILNKTGLSISTFKNLLNRTYKHLILLKYSSVSQAMLPLENYSTVSPFTQRNEEMLRAGDAAVCSVVAAGLNFAPRK